MNYVLGSAFLDFLAKILGKVFEKVLLPILEVFLKDLIQLVVKVFTKIFAWVIYFCFTTLLSVIRFLEQAFEFFAGTQKGLVYYEGKPTTVLEAVFSFSAIQKLFGAFTAIGIILAIVFSIIQSVKSISDMTLDDRHPISDVIKTAFKTAISFAIIPLLCLFLLKMSATLINAIDDGIGMATGNSDLSIHKIIWLNTSLNACSDKDWNTESAPASNLPLIGTSQDPYRKDFLNGTKSFFYTDITANGDLEDYFETYFPYQNFDNFLGIVVSIVVIFILVAVLIGFIRRIFEVMVLYISGPMFAATMPLDEGKMFKKWKDLFIAKFFAGFGPILAMRIFLAITPLLCSGNIVFSEGNGTLNGILQLLIMVGGAYTVYKSQSTFMRIINPEAAAGEEGANALGGAMIGVATGMMTGGASALVGGALNSNKGGGKGGKDNDSSKDAEEEQGGTGGDDDSDSGNEASIPPKPSDNRNA